MRDPQGVEPAPPARCDCRDRARRAPEAVTSLILRVLISFSDLGTSGGIEQSIYDLAPQLAPLGIECEIAVFASGPGDERFRALNVPVHVVAKQTLASRVRAVHQLLRERSPDVVHVSVQRAGIHLPVRAASQAARVPVVATLTAPPRSPGSARSWRRQLLESTDRWTTRHLTQQFHAITHAMKAQWVEARGLPADRITVVERGRDRRRLGTRTQVRRDAARAALGISPESKVVLNVGRQVAEKGQPCLVDAFGSVASQIPDAELLIAGLASRGTSELEARVAACAARDRIRLLGQRSDVPDLLAAADVFAFPSLAEGIGGAMLEAMAMRLPVVASDIPALREVSEDGRCAVLVPPADPARLADGILRVLGEPRVASALGECGQQIFEARFTIERCAPRMGALYRAVAHSRS